MSKRADYEIHRIDETSPLHSGFQFCYMITFRGRRVGSLDIHGNGYRDWTFIAGQPRPSLSTQRKLVSSRRNDR